jgi:3-isopropylmalate/(R)-2-methylmalate dehydratase small subunit
MKLEPFRTLVSTALPLARGNVDTDQIVPARYLQKPRSANFGEFLFRDIRGEVSLERYAGARIIVAGRNFGCGSSREHAVWALYDYGFRAAIAPSFGDIFYANALKSGFLPIPLADAETVLEAVLADPRMTIAIDLETQTAAGRRFEIAPFARQCLLEGLDELGYTLAHLDQIETFERRYKA